MLDETPNNEDDPYSVDDPNAGANLGYESSLSNWAGDYVTDMLGRGWGLADAPYQSYGGPLSAGTSSLQDQAFSGIAGLNAPDYSSGIDTAQGIADRAGDMNYDPTEFSTGRFTDPGVAQSYMNPFIQQALTPELDEMRRQAQITRMGDASRMTKAGAFGGSRQAIMESELNDNTARLMTERVGAGFRDAYNTAGNNFRNDEDRALRADQYSEGSRQFGAGFGLDALRQELAAAESGNQMQGQSFDDAMRLIDNQARLGEQERGITAEGIAADKAQFEEERDYPYKQVQYMQSLLQGLPLEAQQNIYQQPGNLSVAGGSMGGIMEILEGLFG